jgi:protein gp37
MGETTGISWCDHTFNPWIGCTKVSAGCDLCYAETQNNRFQWNPAGWGKGAPRKLTADANWIKPLAWAKQAITDGVLRRVFAGSLCDPFDDEVPSAWRDRYFTLIDDVGEYCRHFRTVPGSGLEFMILTKRIKGAWKKLPGEWVEYLPEYVRLGVTAENQPNADRRIHELFSTWRGKNFISVEPMLGPLDLTHDLDGYNPYGASLDWVIVGGESGAGCRPMNIDWARSVRDQCKEAGVPFFFKQIGGHPNKQHDPARWPADLRIQEFPK